MTPQVSRAHLTTVRYENPIQRKAPTHKPRVGYGEQGKGICPHCKAEVSLRYANSEYRSPTVHYDDIVCANHAVGGGKKTRKDYYCPGSGQLPA